VTGSSESGWYHMAGESVFPTFLLLDKLFSAQCGSVMKRGWLHLCFMEWNPSSDVQCIYLPKSVYILLNINQNDFIIFKVILYFYYCYFVCYLKKNRHITLTVDSSVCDTFISAINHEHWGYRTKYIKYKICTSKFTYRYCVLSFQVFMVMSILMVILWVATPCSLVDGLWRFGGIFRLHLQGKIVKLLTSTINIVWCHTP
jgi:hypothetical protein